MTQLSDEADRRIQEDMQRRWADFVASAGVHSSRIALEILFMLPPEFVDGYGALFHKAVAFDESSREEANPKASGVGAGMRTRQMSGASGKDVAKGRRVKTYWVVKSEAAMKAKESLDRKLLRSVRSALRAAEGKSTGHEEQCPECGRWRGKETKESKR